MTDDTGAGALPNGASTDEPMNAGPAIRVLAQYVKDLSFENPNAPASLRDGAQPKIDLQLDVNARAMEDGRTFEVALRVNARSDRDGEALFIVELVYAGLFQFANVPEDQIEPILLAECPRLLFPFARQIVADASRQGGFPPLMVDPVDFGALYMSQRAAGAVQSSRRADACPPPPPRRPRTGAAGDGRALFVSGRRFGPSEVSPPPRVVASGASTRRGYTLCAIARGERALDRRGAT